MERTHITVLRKNLSFLKANLQAQDALDHLQDYTMCNEAGSPWRLCSTLLDLLMEKGEDGYNSFCEYLEGNQPYIKTQLDQTRIEEVEEKNKPQEEDINDLKEKREPVRSVSTEINQLQMKLASREELTGRMTNEEKQKYEMKLEEETRAGEQFEAKIEEEKEESLAGEEDRKPMTELAEAQGIFAEMKGISISLESVTLDKFGAAGQREVISSQLVSFPAMTLSRERVNNVLTVERNAGQFLTNTRTERSITDYKPERFVLYPGTCSAPIPLPASPCTPTIPRYWETNSRVQGFENVISPFFLDMAVMEDNLETTGWVSLWGGSGWSVGVADCSFLHHGLCTWIYENGEQVGGCLSTTPYPKRGKDTEIRLGIVLDVGRGRLAFIDVNREKVLHKFDVTFHQPCLVCCRGHLSTP